MAVRGKDAHLHLSAFYFFYFASLGAFIPYWGLYLSDCGYGARMIGLLTALLM
ncbi:MAG: MFS transporter, partial [Planctomycetaceae bacterium]|nr:MFS transporter [Planctomycetaceae bacterium]